MDSKIRIGIFFPSLNSWIGGANYYYRLIELVLNNSDDYVFVVFIENDVAHYINLFSENPNVELVYLKSIKQSFLSLLSAVILGKDFYADKLVKKHRIDLLFTNARFFGWCFKTFTLSWVPDLQHLFLPHFFSKFALLRRDFGFKLQALFSSALLFSSIDSRKSFIEKYSPSVPTYVSRFSVGEFKLDRVEINNTSKRYHLNDSYIMLPNQYWPHKNHIKVLEAINYMVGNGLESLQIVSTGLNISKTYDEVAEFILEKNIPESRFKILGVIPSLDLINLVAGAKFVLNPSFFEGWSTTVEEAKSLNKNLILSDINIHKEQAEGYKAVFFDPNSAEDLARILSAAYDDLIKFDNVKTVTSRERNLLFFKEFDFAIKSIFNL